MRSNAPARVRVPRVSRTRVALAALFALCAACAAILVACSQTPTEVPVRTFERAQRMDVVCLQIFDATTLAPIQPVARRQEECAPVAPGVDSRFFINQLFALVTQTTRGEVAVVNLSAGAVVDINRAVPGIDFLPVGAIPTDVATTPDGQMAFVASAEPNKAAIYGIPTRRILGDTEGFPRDPDPVTLASWPVCSLPQNPGALTVVPRRTQQQPPATDAGAGDGDAGDAGDGGGYGGAPIEPGMPEYDLVVVLPGDRRNTAKVITLDPRPFRRGALKRRADGQPDYATDPTLNVGPVLEPGSLAPCPILSAVELVGAEVLPPAIATSPAWDDGVKYVDGGVDLTCQRPAASARCGAQPCCAPATPPELLGDASAVEGGVLGEGTAAPLADAGCQAPGSSDAGGGSVPLALAPAEPPHLVSIVRDDLTLYVADEGAPLVHVLDMSGGNGPRELPPLVATSVSDPSRVVGVKEIAISPPTREYKRYLYAVDQAEGSIMVFDVTDPQTMQRTPLLRAHPELNPFQPADRIAFSAPVAAVAFARHDVPLTAINGDPVVSARSGLLCNPNPNLDVNPQADFGFYYRANSNDPNATPLDPRRLRGIFAFATLSTGQVVTIDVDDWDAPCRRPTHLAPLSDLTNPAFSGAASNGVPYPPESALAVSEPRPTSPSDVDPYHAPHVGVSIVTNEAFFPVSAPHRLRSEVLVRDDPSEGNQLPRLAAPPTVTSNGVVLSTTGIGSEKTPIMDQRFSFEVPDVHINQDWVATFEGALPGFSGVSGFIATDDGYQSLVLSQPQARFCSKGVEDWTQGGERATAITSALAQSRRAYPGVRLDRTVTDYVQLTEDILDASDPYWGLSENPNDPASCWDPRLATPAARHDACVTTFGAPADESPARDFPILEAYEDKVVLGRYYPTDLATREVVYKDPSNADTLKLMRCCFHHQVRFNVRTGGVWSVVGTALGGGPGIGFLSHLTTDASNRCVSSCDSRESLLNGRVPAVPFVPALAGTGRDSALAMRNPMFSMSIRNPEDGTRPTRGTAYLFSTRGEFRSLVVNIAGTSTAVNPQSMRFIETLGQVAVVDAASQGLVLIDLSGVTVARAPYF